MKLCAIALPLLLPALAAINNLDINKTVGNPAAPVTIQVFSDFECPACKMFHDQTLPQLMRDYITTGKVYLVYRDYPLTMHKYSRVAANYATAAARLGFYQPVADALFRDQAAWSVSGKVWESAASVLSADQQRRVLALAGDVSVKSEVERDVNAGEAVPVNATPTLVVSHGDRQYPISGGLNYLLLRRLIDDLAK